jgi:hypothetical protein
VCANGDEPFVDGDLDASPSARHRLRINLRASGDPEIIGQIVLAEAQKLPGALVDSQLQCFRPGAPKPQHRMTRVIKSDPL